MALRGDADVPGFDDLLDTSARSPSSSPVAARSAFFTEELSNPFADLQSSTITSSFVPPSPGFSPGSSSTTPSRSASFAPTISPAVSLSSPTSPREDLSQRTPHGDKGQTNGLTDVVADPIVTTMTMTTTTTETTEPTYRSEPPTVTSPIGRAPADLLTSPLRTPNGDSAPVYAATSDPPSLDAQYVRDDADSVRTVGLDSDRASVRTTLSSATIPISLADPIAKQGIIVSVGDPQKMGSELIASAHTVYTVRTRVLGDSSRASFRKNDFSVLRRFSHFLWLVEQLTTNNPGIIVPAPPEKHVLGRFSSDFVEQRRHALQTCLQRILNHPMLVSDPDLRLFLESDTFAVDIKHRRAEASAERGGLFASLSNAVVSPKFAETDEFFIARRSYLDSLEPQLRSLNAVLQTAAKARTALAASTADLCGALSALTALTGSLPKPNREALNALGALKKRAAELDEEQVAAEEGEAGLTAIVSTYVRLCSSVRLAMASRFRVYNNWQKQIAAARSIRATQDRARARGATPYPDALQELNEAERRADDAKREFEDVSKLLKAEMARFDAEKVEDFKSALNRHTEGLVIRQKQIVASWIAYNDVCEGALASNVGSI